MIPQREVLLEWVRVAAAKVLDGRTVFMNRLDADFARNFNMDAMILQMWTHVLTEDLETKRHDFKAEWPATWWDAFKLRFFSVRLLRWFPVKYETKIESVIYEAKAFYPHLHMSDIPAERSKPVMVHRLKVPINYEGLDS